MKSRSKYNQRLVAIHASSPRLSLVKPDYQSYPRLASGLTDTDSGTFRHSLVRTLSSDTGIGASFHFLADQCNLGRESRGRYKLIHIRNVTLLDAYKMHLL